MGAYVDLKSKELKRLLSLLSKTSEHIKLTTEDTKLITKIELLHDAKVEEEAEDQAWDDALKK